MGDRDTGRGASRQDAGRAPRRISPLELVASGCGIVLTLGILAFIGHEALTGRDGMPPQIVVEQTGLARSGAGWVVEFTAENRSAVTAENVWIVGELRQDGRVIATGRAELDFVPGRSIRRGGLFFPVDPRAHALEVRAVGYSEP